MSLVCMDDRLLENVSAAARAAPRRRKNLNFHKQDTDACHRLLNGVEPDSYIQPHRHLDPAKEESILVLRGRFGVVEFDEAGRVMATVELRADGPVRGVSVPSGAYHTFLSLEPGGVFFESKAGPFVPLSTQEKAAWAPVEGDAKVSAYMTGLKKYFGG